MSNNCKCISCEESFYCGSSDINCWCFDQPHSLPLPEKSCNEGCYCPKCLKNIADKIENGHKFASKTENEL